MARHQTADGRAQRRERVSDTARSITAMTTKLRDTGGLDVRFALAVVGQVIPSEARDLDTASDADSSSLARNEKG